MSPSVLVRRGFLPAPGSALAVKRGGCRQAPRRRAEEQPQEGLVAQALPPARSLGEELGPAASGKAVRRSRAPLGGEGAER